MQEKTGSRLFKTYIFCLLLLTAFHFNTAAQSCPVTINPNLGNICPGGNITLSASAAGASNFSWLPAEGLTNTIGASVSAHPTITTTYTVTAIGCVGTTTVVVKANANPTASFSFSPTSGCAGNLIQFTNASFPSSGLKFNWNFGDPVSGTDNTDTLENPTHTFSAFGTGVQSFTVSLTVTTAAGCQNTTTQTITLTKGPDASIADQNTFSPFTFCQTGGGKSILIINNISTSQATNTNYDIDWGDGTPHYSGATLPNGTTHTYNSLGYFTITVTVDGVNGCSTKKKYIVFNGSNPSVGLGTLGATVNLCGPVTLTFPINNTSGNSPGTKYTVTFSDGGTQIYTHPPPASITHTFNISSCGHSSVNYNNSFYVKIQANNPCGSSTSTVEPIQVGTPPSANMSVSPTSLKGCVNTTNFTFANSSTNNNYIFNGNCNNILTSVWSITPSTNWTVTSGSLTANSFSAVFSQTGTYTIKLISSNPCGTDSFTRTICVVPPPVADFLFSPPSCAPATVNFINQSSSLNTCDNPTYLWTITPATGWSFTGGTTATSTNPSVLFTTTDNFSVKLRISNPCTFDEITKSFNIKSPPSVKIDPIPNICGTPAIIAPTAVFGNGGGTITSYIWSFAGGTPSSSNSQVPGNISYASMGDYTVTVTATNECSSATDTRTFSVAPTLTVNAGSDDSLCSGSFLSLTETETGGTPNFTYFWNPTNSLNNAFIKSPVALPLSNTTYTVTVTDAKGCTASDEITLFVKPSPTLSANASPAIICPGDNAVLTANGAISYEWSPSTALSTTTGNTVTASPASFTIYYVNGTAANGCVGNSYVFVSVNPGANISVSPSNSTICQGNSFNINAFGGSTYQWMPATGLSTTTGSSVTASPVTPVTYTVTGTNASGCSGSATTEVNVVTLPVVTGIADKYTLCTGDSATLSVSGAIDYSWSPSTGLSSTTGATVTANPSVTTTYTVLGVSGLNCEDDDTVVIKVFPYPVVSVNPVSPIICKGQSVNFTAGGADSYTWLPSSGLNSTSGATVTANPVSDVTYTLTGTSINGCSVSTNIPVTIASLLTVDAGKDISVCSNVSNLVLSGFTPQGGTWTGFGISNPSQAFFNPATAGIGTHKLIYTVVSANNCTSSDSLNVTVVATSDADAGSDISSCINSPSFNLSGFTPSGGTWSGAGITDALLGTVNPVMSGLGQHKLIYTPLPSQCYNKDSIILTVNGLPVVNAFSSGSSVCLGYSVNLSASGGIDYTWSPAASLNVSTGSNVTASPASTTSYTVTATDINGCTASAISVIALNPLPVISVTPSSPVICNGDNVTMIASGANTYVWSPVTGLNTTTGSVVNSSTVSSITYVVTGTDVNGCLNSTSVPVTVNMIPQVQISPNNSIICNGQSVTLTASNAATFVWSPATGLSSTTGNLVTATPSATTTYYVSGADAAGCSGSSQSVITVNVPSITYDHPNPTTCRGTALNITANGANTYTWSPLTGLSSGSGSTVSVNPQSTTTYTIVGTDSNGCTGVSTLPFIVHAPYLTVTPSVPALCNGQSITLSTGGSAVSFAWSPSTALSSTSSGNITANPSMSTTYTVIGTDLFNCSDTVSVPVTVYPQPVAEFSFTPASGCDPLTVLFSNQSSFATTYHWDFSDGNTSDEENPSHTFSGNGIYSVTESVEGEGGCKDQVTHSNIVTVYPEPVAFFDYQQNTSQNTGEVHFTNGSVNADSFFWNFGDGDSSSLFNPNHLYNEPGIYTVTLVSSNDFGCVDSVVKDITVTYFKNLYIPDAFSPNSDGKNDVFKVYGQGFIHCSMYIYDRWGNNLFAEEGSSPEWDGTYKGRTMNPAVFVYLIRIYYSDGSTQKLKGDITLIR